MNYTISFFTALIGIENKRTEEKLEMKKLVLISVFFAVGSLWADSVGDFCDLFEYKSKGTVYLSNNVTPHVRKMCDDAKKTDGTYNIDFCTLISFNSDGSVVLKQEFFQGFNMICPESTPPTVETSSKNWFHELLDNYSKAYVIKTQHSHNWH
jgi:hypothetical protein